MIDTSRWPARAHARVPQSRVATSTIVIDEHRIYRPRHPAMSQQLGTLAENIEAPASAAAANANPPTCEGGDPLAHGGHDKGAIPSCKPVQ